MLIRAEIQSPIKLKALPGNNIETFAHGLIDLRNYLKKEYDVTNLVIEGNFNDTILYVRKESTVDTVLESYFAIRRGR